MGYLHDFIFGRPALTRNDLGYQGTITHDPYAKPDNPPGKDRASEIGQGLEPTAKHSAHIDWWYWF